MQKSVRLKLSKKVNNFFNERNKSQKNKDKKTALSITALSNPVSTFEESKAQMGRLSKSNLSKLQLLNQKQKPSNMMKSDRSNSDDDTVHVNLAAKKHKPEQDVPLEPNVILLNKAKKRTHSDTSSNVKLVASNSSNICIERNIYMQQLQEVMNERLERQRVQQMGVKAYSARDMDGFKNEKNFQKIGKIKSQINSAMFYLKKSIVADSETKYYQFNYEAGAGGQASGKDAAAAASMFGGGGMC